MNTPSLMPTPAGPGLFGQVIAALQEILKSEAYREAVAVPRKHLPVGNGGYLRPVPPEMILTVRCGNRIWPVPFVDSAAVDDLKVACMKTHGSGPWLNELLITLNCADGFPAEMHYSNGQFDRPSRPPS